MEPEPDDIVPVRIVGSVLMGTVSVARKVNDGNYGAGEVFFNIQGITAETTDAEMDAMLDQEQIAFDKIRAKIKANYKHALNVTQ